MRTPLPLLLTILVSCSNDVSLKESPNLAPQATIDAPDDGSTFTNADTIDVVGIVVDGDGADDLQTITLSSSLSGELDLLTPDSDNLVRWSGSLEAGVHTLTITAVDTDGAQGTDSVTIEVTAVSEAPTAELQSPNDLDEFPFGTTVPLIGLASDPNQGADTLTAYFLYEPTTGGDTVEIWSGTPTTQGVIDTDWVDAPSGRWKLSLQVVDDDGNSAVDQIEVTIGDDDNSEAFDDDGDCFCEAETCEGSIEPSCKVVNGGDCDDDDPLLTPADLDGDTVSTCDGDCDDGDAARFPGNPEVPVDGFDQDCDGVDHCYIDVDADGFGNNVGPGSSLYCDGPTDAVVGGDCDDTDDDAYPGAVERTASGNDEDCDGYEACYVDGDADGVGTDTTSLSTDFTCATAGLAATTGDCDDAAPMVYPGALEQAADGIDSNCDTLELCYVDADYDQWGTTQTVQSSDLSCLTPGLAAQVLDCDDNDPLRYPSATEIPGSGIDEDCDNIELCYVDDDNDDFGTSATVGSASLTCQGAGIAPTDGDCDDGDVSIFPGANEVVHDGIDSDCDLEEICFSDADGDGYGDLADTYTVAGSSCGNVVVDGDCDDSAVDVNPGATEVPVDGIDNDCDTFEACYTDADVDGFGGDTVLLSTDLDCTDPGELDALGDDCDDNDPAINPSAADVPDMAFVDADCDGIDGASSLAVFVAPDGDDNSADCSQAAPCASLRVALQKLDVGDTQILVQNGDYGAVDFIRDDLGVYGGYDASWNRSDVYDDPGARTVLNGRNWLPDLDDQYLAVRVVDRSAIVLQNLEVRGMDVDDTDAQGRGKATYGVLVDNSDLLVENSIIVGGRASDSLDGADAADEDQAGAPQGNVGRAALDDACGDNNGSRNGGLGAAHTCGLVDTSGGDGGDGGTASCSTGTGDDGEPGEQGFVNGGLGGDAGLASVVIATRNGGRGDPGDDGDPGGTSSGNNKGFLNGVYYTPFTAPDGSAGSAGTGGGGGGGGAGYAIFSFDEQRGASGAGGGAGGCGGAGGSGGKNGGASIALQALDSTVDIVDSELIGGEGGNGGNGGDGGLGEPGGLGGNGGGSSISAGTGGDGGDGGKGGDGAGGTGGAGGNVFTLLEINSTIALPGSSLFLGTPGAAGSGGLGTAEAPNGLGGAAGQAVNHKVCTNVFDC